MTEFDLFNSLEKIARRWWWVALALIVGGVLGYVASFGLKPVYEARAELYVNMNEAQFAEDNHLAAVDVKEREAAMAPVATFLYAPDVVDAVGVAASQKGIALDTENFEFIFFYTRIYTRWLLIVRHSDPHAAADLANLWAQITLDALNKAYSHAVSAHTLELELFTLNQCFKQDDFTTANQCTGGEFKNAADFESHLNDLEVRYKMELEAARNLDYTLDFRLERPASAPTEPVLNRPGLLLLTGALLGFIMGIFVVASVPASRSDHDRA